MLNKLWCTLFVLGTCAISGCGSAGTLSEKDPEPLNWQDAEAALESSDVKTIQDYFLSLSKVAERDVQKKFFADPKRVDDFETLDERLKDLYMQAGDPAKTLDEAKEIFFDEIKGRQPNAKTKRIARIYVRRFREPTRAKRIATWDVGVYVDVYTDNDGNILAWHVPQGTGAE